MMAGLFFMIVELWSVCFLSKTYAEMLQDHANDESDAALVDFVWQRRGETCARASSTRTQKMTTRPLTFGLFFVECTQLGEAREV